jgi:hypothetical protein
VSVDQLATDVGDQLHRGGMVVRTSVPTGLQLFSPVEVAVECGEHAVVVSGQVLQIFPGIGVAVGFDRPARDRIERLAAGTRGDLTPVPGSDSAAVVPGSAGAGTRALRADTLDLGRAYDVEESARLARGTRKPTDTTPDVPRVTMPVAPGHDDPPEPRRNLAMGSSAGIDRIQLALRGDRDQRLEILRGRNRTLHQYVLRNPGLTVDEIAVIARMPTVAPEVLTQIAERREWGHRPDVALSLIRNVATPVPVAVRLLDHVADHDLRQLAKDARTREPVQRAARKKLLS